MKGGKRTGAGRKKRPYPATPIRVYLNKEDVQKVIEFAKRLESSYLE